jgi:tripartite-type tricarboxylate transporter receptor subunit TctC
MKRKISYSLLFVAISGYLLMDSLPALADEFYKGKTIRFVVGAPAGGGYDT